jgi:predicted RND superfamily exporter protein
MAQAVDRAGKPINVADGATVVGFVATISGSGPTATIGITLAGSGVTVNVQAQDIGATTQTL